ncbi:MAG: DUF2510 domain-containing protein [Actinomycetota bacterium]|nr:DUF2510 domain-containing protein [Actinomycetota bacterium]MDA2949660.1 DUF2510 domain-containing protein [Actinomycetota bacterium]MDA2992121.1 DUF2510 domain-containing protein [Actinomycetota bacterium]
MTTPATPPAGWYPDPTGKPGNLYWDGAQWHSAIPAEPKPKSRARKFLWMALAGFVLQLAARNAGSPGSDLVPFFKLAGLLLLGIGLAGFSVMTLIEVAAERRAEKRQLGGPRG